MATFGIMHRDGSYEPKSDFSLKLDMLVEAEENTGYLCTVKRAIDKKEVSTLFIRGMSWVLHGKQ